MTDFSFLFCLLFVPVGWDKKALEVNDRYLMWLTGNQPVNDQTSIESLVADGMPADGTLDVIMTGEEGEEGGVGLLLKQRILGGVCAVGGPKGRTAKTSVPLESMVRATERAESVMCSSPSRM